MLLEPNEMTAEQTHATETHTEIFKTDKMAIKNSFYLTVAISDSTGNKW